MDLWKEIKVEWIEGKEVCKIELMEANVGRIERKKERIKDWMSE